VISAAIFVAFLILAVASTAMVAEDSVAGSSALFALAMVLFFVWAWRINRPTPDQVWQDNARATIAAATFAVDANATEAALATLEAQAAAAATAAGGE
jgi:hypothetical protein